MNEFNDEHPVKIGTEKNFGIVFAAVFLVVGLYPLLDGEKAIFWSLFVSSALLITAFVAPGILAVPNRLWFKFGLLLGSIVAPIVMAFIYIFAVTPVGLLARAVGKDFLSLKTNKKATSYWIEREQPPGSMKDQF